MTLIILEGHFPIAALASVIFHICGASHSPCASAELLVINLLCRWEVKAKPWTVCFQVCDHVEVSKISNWSRSVSRYWGLLICTLYICLNFLLHVCMTLTE